MSKLLKSHAVGLPVLKKQQSNREENLTKHVGFVYTYEKNAKNRKIIDGKGGDKQKKQD